MIAKLIGLFDSPTKTGQVRIAFQDEHEMSWWVEAPVLLNIRQVESLLNSMLTISTDPQRAIDMGIITREDYEEALKLRDEYRAAHPKTSEQVH